MPAVPITASPGRVRFTPLVGTDIVRLDFGADNILRDFRNDIQTALRVIAKVELANQIRLGNDQFTVLVDGVQGKSIDQAERRVVVNFLGESVPLALQYVFQVIYRVVYGRFNLRSGRLGTDWKPYLNGKPALLTQIRTIGPNDKIVVWAMTHYARRLSRIFAAGSRPVLARQMFRRGTSATFLRANKRQLSMVSQIASILRRDGRFRGIRFRALDMPADLGDGLGRRRRVGILIQLSRKLRVVAPGAPGRVF